MATVRTQEQLTTWANQHFPHPSAVSDEPALEWALRSICVSGAGYLNRYATSTNRTLHVLRERNRYLRYFTNQAKLTKLGSDKFYEITMNGGLCYTNEYLYATVLLGYVPAAVSQASSELISMFHSEENEGEEDKGELI